jgi:septal ring factor EnvC (AmiA/AmiB activator)
MKALDNEIHQNTNTIRSLKSQLEELKEDYAGMVRFAQRNRNAYDKMMFIFASKDFNQAYKRIKYLQQFGQYRKKQANYIQSTQQTLNNKITILDKSLKEKSNLLKEQESERNKLGKNKSKQSAVLNQFTRKEREYKQDIANRKKQQAAVDRQIRAAINREIAEARRKAEEAARAAAAAAKAENKPAPAAAKPGANYLNATPEAAKLSASFESNRGRLPWPVSAGSITEGFGRHTEGQASYMNDGVHIMTNEGAPVKAVFNGKVLFVQNLFGTYIVALVHGEYFTIYQNLKSVTVAKGDNVTTKQVLGTIATTADGPMLHFEIMRSQTKLNPEAWIAK